MTTEQTAITQYKNNSIIRSYDDAERAAKAMATSGYFQDAHQAAQAVVKILAGQEMGFGPFASMTGVYIIQGRPSIGANLMAAAVKKSGRYNYRVIEMTDKTCSVDFYEGKEKIGTSTFTEQDARKAGTKNMDKYPRNMLFARAISNGIKWFCPDVFNGSPVYTPEELGANVNEDGEVIDIAPAQKPPKADIAPDEPERAVPPLPEELRYDPESLKTRLVEIAKAKDGKTITPEHKGLIATTLETALGTPDPKAARKMLLKYLTGHDSLTELNDATLLALYAWLKPYKNDASGEWLCDEMAAREARAAFNAAQPPQQGLFQ